jgi:hypothetical protein
MALRLGDFLGFIVSHFGPGKSEQKRKEMPTMETLFDIFALGIKSGTQTRRNHRPFLYAIDLEYI